MQDKYKTDSKQMKNAHRLQTEYERITNRKEMNHEWKQNKTGHPIERTGKQGSVFGAYCMYITPTHLQYKGMFRIHCMRATYIYKSYSAKSNT